MGPKRPRNQKLVFIIDTEIFIQRNSVHAQLFVALHVQPRCQNCNALASCEDQICLHVHDPSRPLEGQPAGLWPVGHRFRKQHSEAQSKRVNEPEIKCAERRMSSPSEPIAQEQEFKNL